MNEASESVIEAKPARTRSTAKGEATRAAVKQATKRAIASHGFLALKVADVMSEVDRSPSAFYVYFKTKEAVLFELLEDFRHHLREEVNRPLAPGEGPVDHLMDRVAAFWRIYREEWPVATAGFQMAMVDPQFARAWRHVRQQGIRGFGMLIRGMQKQGYAKNIDADLASSALCSMLEYTCFNWTAKVGDFPDRVIDNDTAIEVLTQLVTHALGWRKPYSTGAAGTE